MDRQSFLMRTYWVCDLRQSERADHAPLAVENL